MENRIRILLLASVASTDQRLRDPAQAVAVASQVDAQVAAQKADADADAAAAAADTARAARP